MSQYIIRRLLSSLLVLLVVTILIFVMVRLIPGDPATVKLGPEATKVDLELLRRYLGLDKPATVQYFLYMGNLLRGDMGISTRSGLPVTTEIMSRLPNTLLLAATAILIAIVLGVTIGVIAGAKQSSLFDAISMPVALFGVSMPSFWLGLMLILLFSVKLGWFPSAGAGSLRHLILPALTLGVGNMAIIARMTRSSMLEVIRLDYVRTARAKGLTERRVVFVHALKNALIPVVTIVGLQAAGLLAGAVLVEIVFAWPGIGRLLVDAIFSRDYFVIQAVVLIIATGFILVNLVVDIAYAYLDPRIHYQ